MENIILATTAALASSIITSILSHWLITRQLRQETAQENRRIYLEKHIEACTAFWALLAPTSKYLGENRIIKQDKESLYLDIKVTRQFCQDVTNFFFSKHGIFMSQEFRDALFGTRDYLDTVMEEAKEESPDIVRLSKTKAGKIEDSFRWLRETTRNEIVVKNLRFEKQEVTTK